MTYAKTERRIHKDQGEHVGHSHTTQVTAEVLQCGGKVVLAVERVPSSSTLLGGT